MAALDDPARSTISDPRYEKYAVSFIAPTLEEARALAATLEAAGVTVQINPWKSGTGAYVAIYKLDALRRLLELAGSQLSAERRQRLDDLVRARGPIPEGYLMQMRQLRAEGVSYARIAERMNIAGLIDGMGGGCWTDKKVAKVLREHTRNIVL